MDNTSPAFQIAIIEDVTTEPVTVAEVKSFSHLDADYVKNDANLSIMIGSAREKLEGALNLFFGVKKVNVQFYGNALTLPYGPTGSIISVIKNNETDPLDTDKYTIEGLNYKTIYIGDGACSPCCISEWFYPVYGGFPLPWVWTEGCRDFYTVQYNTGYVLLPKILKHAVLMLVDYMIKEQGTTDLEIPPAIMKLANRFSQNLPIQ